MCFSLRKTTNWFTPVKTFCEDKGYSLYPIRLTVIIACHLAKLSHVILG